MEGQEQERWRQFCMQYAKSVAFKFTESWQQFSMSQTKMTVNNSDVIEQFTRTMSDELRQRLQAQEKPSKKDQQRLSDSNLFRLEQSNRTNVNELSQSLQALTVNNMAQSTSSQHAPNVAGSTSLFSLAPNFQSSLDLDKFSSCTFMPVNMRENGVSWQLKNRWMRSLSYAGNNSLINWRSETIPTDSTSRPNAADLFHGAPSVSRKLFGFLRSRFPTKTAVEIIKDGHVRYMSGCDVEIRQWKKCRLCLMMTTGGYLLEFYVPPRSNRAKSGIFCFLIIEIREATPLEFENANGTIFAIRGHNHIEYVIEAKSNAECQKWINTIRECMTITSNGSTFHNLTRHPSAPNIGTQFSATSCSYLTRSSNNVHQTHAVHFHDHHVLATNSQPIPPGMKVYPWFHAQLSRTLSTRLVLYNGTAGHGLFLVRQSETRSGEFVLTFNCQGKAKHVRIAVMSNGECKINNMTFDSMVDLLENFRRNPLPLEGCSNPPMLLKEYVICWRRRSIEQTSNLQDFLTYAGSLRIDVRTLEELARRDHLSHIRRNISTVQSNAYRYF